MIYLCTINTRVRASQEDFPVRMQGGTFPQLTTALGYKLNPHGIKLTTHGMKTSRTYGTRYTTHHTISCSASETWARSTNCSAGQYGHFYEYSSSSTTD